MSDEEERIFRLVRSRKLPLVIQRTALRLLLALMGAINKSDLREPPSNHRKNLCGDRAGLVSVWRTTLAPRRNSG